VERTDPRPACRAALVEAFAVIWDKIKNGTFDPNRIHACIEPYSVTNQMTRLFACHREMQDARRIARSDTRAGHGFGTHSLR
jgi:hypothetical protein